MFFFQQHDKHNTRGYYKHASVVKHGEILEGPTRDLRHTQASGGACQECALPQTSTVSGHVLSQVGAAGQENQEDQALMLLLFKRAELWRLTLNSIGMNAECFVERLVQEIVLETTDSFT